MSMRHILNSLTKVSLVILISYVAVHSLANVYNHKIKPSRKNLDIRRCNNCSSYNLLHTVNTTSVCSPDTKLVILVLSTASDIQKRTGIRTTWGSISEQERLNFRVMYVIGNYSVNQQKSAITEDKKFGDVIHLKMLESYRNLSLKVVHAFQWALNFCTNARYIMKTDSDVYLNVQLILDTLKHFPLHNQVGGKCFNKYTQPIRSNKSKYLVSKHTYPLGLYPPYCTGVGYIMKRETARKIYSTLVNLPILPMEDAYIGLAAYLNNITLQNLPGYYWYNPETTFLYDPVFCYCQAVVHSVSYKKGLSIWEEQKKCPNLNDHDLYIYLCYIVWLLIEEAYIFIIAICIPIFSLALYVCHKKYNFRRLIHYRM